MHTYDRTHTHTHTHTMYTTLTQKLHSGSKPRTGFVYTVKPTKLWSHNHIHRIRPRNKEQKHNNWASDYSYMHTKRARQNGQLMSSDQSALTANTLKSWDANLHVKGDPEWGSIAGPIRRSGIAKAFLFPLYFWSRLLKTVTWKSQKNDSDSCHSVPISPHQLRHKQGQHIWQKYQICHEPAFFCSLAGQKANQQFHFEAQKKEYFFVWVNSKDSPFQRTFHFEAHKKSIFVCGWIPKIPHSKEHSILKHTKKSILCGWIPKIPHPKEQLNKACRETYLHIFYFLWLKKKFSSIPL